MKFNRVSSFFLAFILSFTGIGQISIDNTTFSTTQLVDGVLVPTGSGTVISNVTYQGVYNNGGDYQVGYFSTAGTTQTEMEFTEGVVLTTGNTSDIPLTLGTNPGSVAQISTNFTSCTPGEIRRTGTCGTLVNDLDILAQGENYYNAVILEFDFIPVTDFVEFKYVFGSEEYEDDGGFINYQCSSYNDRFGFLISGPGINGGQGYDNDAENIATLANGSPVGINSVNNGIVGSSGGAPSATNCQNANPAWIQNVSTAEYGGTIDGTQLNGNTIALTATKNNLTPGQTYHIKLLITDVFDGAYDAVVYLEAGSFTTEAPTCGITDITAGTQTACDPLTNEYTQEVTVTYANPPATGTLDVNGQSFVIGTSPQTVTLTGLTADGNAVDVTAVFSDDAGCTFTVNSLFTAPVDCTPIPCGITDITAGTQTACDPLTNEYTQEVTVTYANPPATGTLDVNGQSFTIGTSPQTITLTGLTADGNAVDVTAVFSDDAGCTFTVNSLFTAPVDCTPIPCGITDITAGTQTACDPLTNEYTQEVTVTYANPPATGTLDVNGQSFAIGTSPQTVTLTGLTADGNAVDVTAVFSDDAGCTFTVNSLFIAAGECEVECGELYVPTAFSPNGDGNNDEFMFRLNELCVESMELSVYNRWGERIFNSDDMSNTWDGTYKDKPCETGVYVYKLLIKIQGETDSRMETGNINLIR